MHDRHSSTEVTFLLPRELAACGNVMCRRVHQEVQTQAQDDGDDTKHQTGSALATMCC